MKLAGLRVADTKLTAVFGETVHRPTNEVKNSTWTMAEAAS